MPICALKNATWDRRRHGRMSMVRWATRFAFLLATFIGFNYGANLVLFPSFTKDFWGLKNFGTNYGVLFTAWGVGGFVFPKVQQTLTASSGGSFQSSLTAAGAVLLLGALLAPAIKPPQRGA